nr:autotransporter domain-containing protein [uncultured Pseudodesulfovibrio sp.]
MLKHSPASTFSGFIVSLIPILAVLFLLSTVSPSLARYKYRFTTDSTEIITDDFNFSDGDDAEFPNDDGLPTFYNTLFSLDTYTTDLVYEGTLEALYHDTVMPNFRSFCGVRFNPSATPGTFTNNGTIIIDAYGQSNGAVAAAPNVKLINNGTMDITYHWGTEDAAFYLAAANTTAINNGTMILKEYIDPGSPRQGARLIKTDTSATNATVVNTGKMYVLADDPDAAGMHLGGSGIKVTNTGEIHTTGQSYEIYIQNGSVKLVDTYNMVLDGDPNHASIRIMGWGSPDLDLNDAKLLLTSLEGDTQWNTDYKLFDDPINKTHGTFSSVEAVNPNVTAVYTPGATHHDDTVRLEYAPPASPANVAADVAELSIMNSVNVVHNRMATNAMMQSLGQTLFAENDESIMVADARSTMTDVGSSSLAHNDEPTTDIFAMPYGSWAKSTRSPMGYEARTGGVTLGFEYQDNGSVLGVHGGFGHAVIDFTGSGYTDNNENQTMFTLGVHGGTVIDDWVLGGSVTPYFTLHEYDGKTGAALDVSEKADYTSFGAVSRAIGGYRFILGDDILMPTAGLTHLWIHRDKYSSKANGTWDTTYSTLDDHELQANAGLRWMRTMRTGVFTVVPSVYAGLRQTLTDGSVSTSQSVPGAQPVSVDSKSDLTAANFETFISFAKDDWSCQLGYAGEYAETTVEHGAWLRVKWDF